jgi:hypothetical protein
LHSDEQLVDGVDGPVSARAWVVALPYWFLVLVGLPMPLLWMRVNQRRRTDDGALASFPRADCR